MLWLNPLNQFGQISQGWFGSFFEGDYLIRLGSKATNADMPDSSKIQHIQTFHFTLEFGLFLHDEICKGRHP